MSAGSALVAGKRAHAQHAADAVSKALQRAGLSRADAVLLYLSPEFNSSGNLAADAVLAAARAAQSTQIAGAVTAGIFTEEGFSLEHPCAAALALGDGLGFAAPDAHSGTASVQRTDGLIHVPSPRLSFFSGPIFPEERPRHACLGCIGGAPEQSAPAPVWQQGRAGTARPAHIAITGAEAEILVCQGFQILGPVHRDLRAHGRKLLSVDGIEALQSLLRELPASLCRAAPLPLQRIFALIVSDADSHAPAEELLARGLFFSVPLLGANADASLELGARLPAGHSLFWALRRPETAAAETQARIASLSTASPSFALAFSCLARGPFLYDGKDLDLKAFTGRFPRTPLLGAYCVEQISPFSRPLPRAFHGPFTEIAKRFHPGAFQQKRGIGWR